MEFAKFDIKHHDLFKVADLIFETEPDLLLPVKNKSFLMLMILLRSIQLQDGHSTIQNLYWLFLIRPPIFHQEEGRLALLVPIPLRLTDELQPLQSPTLLGECFPLPQ